MKVKKKRIASEFIYISAILLLSFTTNLMALANLGMSMIVSPAYILSQKIDRLSYGQAEYIVAGILFVIFCLVMRKFKMSYLSSFITGLLYATMADLWKMIIPLFHSLNIMPFSIRIIYFVIGLLLSAMAIAMFYNTYLYPQIYDFFVKEVSNKYHISLQKFKTGFDCTFLLISIILSLCLFHQFIGVGIGTVIMAFCNGTLIGFFQSLMDKYILCVPHFKKLYHYLETEGGKKNGI